MLQFLKIAKVQGFAGRVMAFKLARSQRIAGLIELKFYRTHNRFDGFDGESTETVNIQMTVFGTNDGGFEAHAGRPTVEDIGHFIAQLFFNMGGLGWTHVTKGVGTGCCQRKRQALQQCKSQRVIGYSDTNPTQSGTYQIRYFIGLGKQQGEWARPKGFGQGEQALVAEIGKGGCRFEAMGVYDQRIKERTVFCFEYRKHCLLIKRIGSQPVHGFGWDGDQFSIAEHPGCVGYVFSCFCHGSKITISIKPLYLLRLMSEVITIRDKTFKPYITHDRLLDSVSKMAEQINQEYKQKVPLFLVVLNGAFMFSADLLKHITVPCEISFVKLSSYTGTVSGGDMKQLIGLNEELNGRHVIIVEDVVDTGKTIEHLLSLTRGMGAASVEVATAFFKAGVYGGSHRIRYACEEIGDEFVVGYGMDYDGYGRNLKDLYVLV